MQLHPINQEILKHIEHFQSLTEVENYLNSENFKNLAIELQIDKIKHQYDKKNQKKYIKQIQDNILLIHQNLHFSINDFKIENKPNTHFSSFILSEKEKKVFQHTYCGKITIKLDEPLTYNHISPTFLLQDTIFNTGSGGGGNVSQYEFKFLEKHLPNLSNQFLLDFKKNNSLLQYRTIPTNEAINDDIPTSLMSKQLTLSPNKINNKQTLLNSLENIFDTHFLNNNNDKIDILAVNIIHNVINIHSYFIKSLSPQLNNKYMQYLKNAICFIENEQNIEKIIQHNLPNNQATRYDNIKKIKENIKNTNKHCQLAIMKFASTSEKIEIYHKIINSDISSKLSNNLILRSDAIRDKQFLNYCFNPQDEIPKFFNSDNINQNITYYLSTNINISQKQKSKNEQLILDILQKKPNDKVTQSAMFQFFYSPDNSPNPFPIENKQLINFFINHYISIKSNDLLDKIETTNFLKVCKYIHSFDNYQFKLNDSNIAIQFLFVLTHQKKSYQDSNNNPNTSQHPDIFRKTINMFDDLFEKTNEYLSHQTATNKEQPSKKMKI